jgi:protein-S-isoprenylcysteine O-methyltransferase Ste14
VAFLILLSALLAMRLYFMVRVRRAGERLMPDKGAIKREGGHGYLIARMVLFFALLAFLGMYIAGMAWMDALSFPLPAWVRWAGFGLGLLSVVFWTWTQVNLDTQWSAQLQLRNEHRLVTSGPYARIRHPLYLAMSGWAAGISLLTANWVFVAMTVLAITGTLARIPREEQMMLDAFGDDYKEYMQRTGRFFPRL